MVHDQVTGGSASERRRRASPVPRIEAYQSGRETVIFDGHNPLAWIASSAAVPIRQTT